MIEAIVQVLSEVVDLSRREFLLCRVAAPLDLMLQRVQRSDLPASLYVQSALMPAARTGSSRDLFGALP
jgi:hypothetical protein